MAVTHTHKFESESFILPGLGYHTAISRTSKRILQHETLLSNVPFNETHPRNCTVMLYALVTADYIRSMNTAVWICLLFYIYPKINSVDVLILRILEYIYFGHR